MFSETLGVRVGSGEVIGNNGRGLAVCCTGGLVPGSGMFRVSVIVCELLQPLGSPVTYSGSYSPGKGPLSIKTLMKPWGTACI